MNVLGEKQVGMARLVRGDADPASNTFGTIAFPLEHSSSTVHHKVGLLPLFCSFMSCHTNLQKPLDAPCQLSTLLCATSVDVSLVF